MNYWVHLSITVIGWRSSPGCGWFARGVCAWKWENGGNGGWQRGCRDLLENGRNGRMKEAAVSCQKVCVCLFVCMCELIIELLMMIIIPSSYSIIN